MTQTKQHTHAHTTTKNNQTNNINNIKKYRHYNIKKTNKYKVLRIKKYTPEMAINSYKEQYRRQHRRLNFGGVKNPAFILNLY